MYVRGPTALAEPTKRLRLRRRIANMGPIAFVLAAAVLLVSFSLIPAIGHNDAASNVIFFAVCGALILVWIVCLNGFNSGRLKCPCCANSFTVRRVLFQRFRIPAVCESCGYNISTGHRPGDF